MSDDESLELEESPGGSKKMLILAAVGAFLIGGGAGGGGAYFALSGTPEPTPDGEEAAAVEAADANAPRAVQTLDRFTVNLRGTGGGRVLRMEVQVEVPEDELDTVVQNTPQLRDGVLTLASDYTYADLEGIDGKMRLRDELLARLNGYLGAAIIKRVYFTEFVVQ